ncbi:MAG: ABC transporter substrate-binding protein [Reyranellaceae bacterium]
MIGDSSMRNGGSFGPKRAFAAAVGALAVAFTGAAMAQDKPALKKATLVVEWIGYQPQHFGFWIAKERGWYADAGFDLEIKGTRGSAQVLQIMTGKGGDFSMVASSSYAQAMGGKSPLPLKIVAMWGQKDILSVAYFESTGIKTLHDFEGRTMGIVPGSMAHIIWPAFTKSVNIDASKVKLQNWDFRSYFGIWGAKKVDISGNSALGTTSPAMFKKRQNEIVKQVAFSHYLPLLGPAVMVHNDTIANDPESVRKFVKVTQRAWEYLRDKPKEATLEAAKIVFANYEKIDPVEDLAEYSLEVIPDYMVSDSTKGKPIGWMNPDDWKKMTALLKEHDPSMTSLPAVEDMMTNRFVE